tara:strand:- start:6616 stop:10506 length:3891 start_codon:yes stop_codon:yes gene_type:complete
MKATSTKTIDLNRAFKDWRGNVYGVDAYSNLVMWLRMTATTPTDAGPNKISTVSYENSAPTSEVQFAPHRGFIYRAVRCNDSSAQSAYATAASGLLSFSSLGNGGTPTVTSDRPFSVSMWVNFDNITGIQYLFGKSGGASDDNEYRAYASHLDNKVYFKLEDSSASSATAVVVSPAIVAPGYWMHLVFTYDGNAAAAVSDASAANGMKIYMNGVDVSAGYINNSSYVGMVPYHAGRLYVGGQQDGTDELDGRVSDFAVFSRVLTPTEIQALNNSYRLGAYNLSSGFLDTPPRLRRREMDDVMLYDYPVIDRTGDADWRAGISRAPFSDNATVMFTSASSGTTPDRLIQYPEMMPLSGFYYNDMTSFSTAPYFNMHQSDRFVATPNVSSSIRIAGSVPQTSYIGQSTFYGIDMRRQFGSSFGLSPFDESKVYLSSSNSPSFPNFWSTGTEESILPGFSMPLRDKTIIEIKSTPLVESKVCFSTGTTIVTNGSSYPSSNAGAAAGINSGILYYAWDSRKFEIIGDLTTGSNVDYMSGRTHQVTSSYLVCPQNATYYSYTWDPSTGGPGNLNRQWDGQGAPSSSPCGFPLASKFNATASHYLSMKNYISQPFLLEKVVLEASGAFGGPGYELQSDRPRDSASTTTFILMRSSQPDPWLNFSSTASTPIRFLDRNNYSAGWTGNRWARFEQTQDQDIIWYNRVGVFSTDTNGWDTVSEFSASSPIPFQMADTWVPAPTDGGTAGDKSSFTGSVRMEAPCRMMSVAPATNRPLSGRSWWNWVLDGNTYASAPNKGDWFLPGNYYGGTSLFSSVSPRKLSRTVAGGQPVAQQFAVAGTPGLGYPIFNKVVDVSPYLLFPNDNLVLGVIRQMTPTNVSSAGSVSYMQVTESDIAGFPDHITGRDFSSKIATGEIKLTLYGSLVKGGSEFHFGSNQPLTSLAVHEDVHYDSGPILDQFLVEKDISYAGGYLDEVYVGTLRPKKPYGTGRGYIATRRVAGRTSMGTQGVTGSLLRGVKLRDSTERYYDSLLPDINQYFSKRTISGSVFHSRNMGGSSTGGFKRLGSKRAYYLSGALELNGTPGTSFGNFQWKGNASLPWPYLGDPERDYRDARSVMVFSASSDNSKISFIKGYSRVKEAMFRYGLNRSYPGTILDKATNSTTPVTIRLSDGKFMSGATGFRYGIVSTSPLYSEAVFRYDRYGQLRDMLEQRHDTRFWNAAPDVVSPKGDSPIKIIFVDRASDSPISPSQTMSQNLSYFATSSVPYFDGRAVERGDDPDKIQQVTVTEILDPVNMSPPGTGIPGLT